MSTRHRHIVFSAMVLVLSLSACAPTSSKLKLQGETQRVLAEEYIRAGNYTAALRHLLDAESKNPEDPVLHNDLGVVYMEKGRLDQAIVHFKRAMAMNPQYSEAKNNLGVAYLKKKEWEPAIAIFKDLTTDLLYPTPQLPLLNLGWAYYNKAEYKTAAEYYHEVLKLDPKSVKALRGMGMIYMATGNAGKATRMFEKAIEVAPGAPLLHMDLAGACVVTGDVYRAREAYLTVVELAPDSDMAEEARDALARIGQ